MGVTAAKYIAPARKDFSITALKVLDEQRGIFEGYLACYSLDSYNDVIEPGAFAKTLNDARIQQKSRGGNAPLFVLLWQHQTDEPIGWIEEAHEDTTGLYIKAHFDLDTEQGRRAYSAVKHQYVQGLSIGYETVKYRWVGDVRHLTEIKLFEGSVCTFQANPDALITTVKSEDKAASQADKDAQEARSKKYGIGIKPGGAVTKPSQWDSLTDADFGDPVNYAYPMPDKAHADDAAARFMAPDALAVYTAKEQAIVAKRIMAKQTSYGEKPDWWPPKDDSGKGANVTRRMRRAAADGQPVKALDFNAALQQVSADDQLQDDWGDSFQAFVNAMCSVMCQAVYGAGMGGDDFDGQAAAETVLEQFSAHMTTLVKQSLAASFVPALDDDGDSFLDPDGPNAGGDDDDDSYGSMGMMSANTARMGRKSGRTLSADNHAMMTKALGMIGEGHKALSEFVKSNAPANADANAGNPNPPNPGDEPPNVSDNVYDPQFGKSGPAAIPDTAAAYAHRAGALAAYRPALTAVTTPAGQHGAGAQASADAQAKATATTQNGDVASGAAQADDDEIAQMRALLAQMRGATTGAPQAQPVAAQ